MPLGPQTSSRPVEEPATKLAEFLKSSSDLMSRSEGLHKVAQRIGVPSSVLGDLQLGSGQSGLVSLLRKIKNGEVPEVSHESLFRQIACLSENIDVASRTDQDLINAVTKKYFDEQAPQANDPQEKQLISQSIEEILRSGVLSKAEIEDLAHGKITGPGRLYGRVELPKPLSDEFVSLVKTRMFSRLITSATNEFEGGSPLAIKANLVRLNNFSKLDRSIQNAYLQHITDNFDGAATTRFDSLKAAIKNVLGEAGVNPGQVDHALNAAFQANWNQDPLLAVGAVKQRFMTIAHPLTGENPPNANTLRGQIAQLVSNYSQTLGRRATQAQIFRACQNNVLKFVMSTVPPAAGQRDDRLLHAKEFVHAVFSEVLGIDNVGKIGSVQFNGCLVLHPNLGAEQFGYKPSLAPVTGSAREVKDLSGRKVALPYLGASKLNMKGARAQQEIFQPTVNMAADKFYDLKLKEKFDGRTIGPEKMLRNIARGLRHETYRDQENRFVPPNVERVQAGVPVGGNLEPKTTYQISLHDYVKDLHGYALGRTEMQSERNEKLMGGLNDLFLGKFAQAGFHARKYDRVVKDQLNQTEKNLRFKAPGAENKALSDFTNHTSRVRSFFLSSRTYGISAHRPDRISDNAARLKFSVVAGEQVMAELIKTPTGTMPVNAQGVRDQLARNLGLDDLRVPQTWGDLAEKAKLVFVACTDRTLRQNLGDGTSHGSRLLNKAVQYAAKSTNYFNDKVDPAEVQAFLTIAQEAIVHNTGWVRNGNLEGNNPYPAVAVQAAGIFNRPTDV